MSAGVQPPEAVGVESVLAGLRDTITGDDELLTAAPPYLTDCLQALTKEYPRNESTRTADYPQRNPAPAIR
ncbi:MAG: hypothetical protein U1D41_04410 [Nitrosomonas sp.]|uniref:hypothetical protein n=1 Tax=Nitrosomonas sp. TaxID=42353 RepID=UPI002736F81E|nr:hypothetical protein [Nitrosomonas sp.]MDP1933748.1 hypothetical protein [Nitrosomonas sp.]MDP3664758.1 hypothetical protein [Nitrosomonas sp.]MDZ4105399.1 hypothetical protein [Nitrosomonas sp.]